MFDLGHAIGLLFVAGVCACVRCGGDHNPVKEFQIKNYGANWTYPDYTSLFKAELYDADEWVKIFESSGAQ